MKCPSCFADLPEGARFCDHCGTPIGQVEAPAAPAAPVAEQVPVQPVAPPVTPPYSAPVTPGYAPSPMPQAPAPAPAASGGKEKEDIFAIVSLVLGVISLCASVVPICGLPLALGGLVLGFLGLKSSQRTLAIIGLVASGVGLMLGVFIVLLGGLAMVGGMLENTGSYMGY